MATKHLVRSGTQFICVILAAGLLHCMPGTFDYPSEAETTIQRDPSSPRSTGSDPGSGPGSGPGSAPASQQTGGPDGPQTKVLSSSDSEDGIPSVQDDAFSGCYDNQQAEELWQFGGEKLSDPRGFAMGRSNANLVWILTNTGDILAISADGSQLATIRLFEENADATYPVRLVDVQDLAIAPNPAGRGFHLYIADIGNPYGDRSEALIYRVAEPVLSPAGGTPARLNLVPEKMEVEYHDSNRRYHASTLMVDPRSGQLGIITQRRFKYDKKKQRDKIEDRTELFIVEGFNPHQTVTTWKPRRMTGFPGEPTMADIVADGSQIILADANRARIYKRRWGTSFHNSLEQERATWVEINNYQPDGSIAFAPGTNTGYIQLVARAGTVTLLMTQCQASSRR